MIIAQGRKTAEISANELREQVAGYDAVVIDIGTGDGRFVYDHAAQHPEHFVIGLDPVLEAMREYSGRIQRRRTRLENALYVVASVEQMPPELDGLASQVIVNLPWGSLMRGLILGDQQILAHLARIGAPGASYRIVLNTRIFDDPVPVEARDLPEPTPDYVERELAPVYAGHELRITSVRLLPLEELLELPTTWARRLSHRTPPPSVEIRAVRQLDIDD